VSSKSSIRTGPGRASFATLFILLAPALAIFIAMVLVPVVQAAVFSLYKWNGLGPMVDFRGFRNFQTLLSDEIVGKALSHNVFIALASLLVQLPLAMGLALIVSDEKFKGAVFFRTFFFLPYVLSEAITGVLWQFIYQPQFGLVKAIWTALFPGVQSPALLGDTKTVFWAILAVVMWKYFGLHMTIYVAGLQDIPKDQIEAATIDGASKARIFRSIVIPGMRVPIQLTVFFSMIGSFQVFDIVWAMGRGDPVNAAETVVTYLYKMGLQRFNIGYGGAIAVFIFLLCLLFNVLYQKVLVREDR